MTVISVCVWRKDWENLVVASLIQRCHVGFNCILRSCWLALVLEEFSPNSVSGQRRATISRLPPQQLGVADQAGSEKLSCRRPHVNQYQSNTRTSHEDDQVPRYIIFIPYLVFRATRISHLHHQHQLQAAVLVIRLSWNGVHCRSWKCTRLYFTENLLNLSRLKTIFVSFQSHAGTAVKWLYNKNNNSPFTCRLFIRVSEFTEVKKLATE